jgi:hypothetical protein
MATNDNNTPITILKPCFECGGDAACFGWEAADMVYCVKCSPCQRQRVKFEVLEELRAQGLDVSVWGR